MKVQTTWGLRLINDTLNHPSTLKIDASDMRLDGFRDDIRSEYRQRSVVRTHPGGALNCTAPACGQRYLGFVIYEKKGPQKRSKSGSMAYSRALPSRM